MLKLVIKRNTEKSYLIEDFMGTRMSKETFELMKKANPEKLKGYEMLSKEDTDCTWWDRTFKKLTTSNIQSSAFTCDALGKVRELK